MALRSGAGTSGSAAASGTSWAAKGRSMVLGLQTPRFLSAPRGASGALERERAFVPRIAVIQGFPEGLLGGERWER